MMKAYSVDFYSDLNDLAEVCDFLGEALGFAFTLDPTVLDDSKGVIYPNKKGGSFLASYVGPEPLVLAQKLATHFNTPVTTEVFGASELDYQMALPSGEILRVLYDNEDLAPIFSMTQPLEQPISD